MDTMIAGDWGACPVCAGRGYEWVDAGGDCGTKWPCFVCGGSGQTWEESEEPAGAWSDADRFVDNVVAAHFDRLPAA